MGSSRAADSDVRFFQVCGQRIAALTPQAAVKAILAAVEHRRSLQVHLCNAYTLSLVDSDAVLREALQQADLNLPDGAPVAWLGRKFGCAQPVRGPQLILDVAQGGMSGGVKHYLYGGKDGVAVEVEACLQLVAPNITIVGTETPPFHDLSDAEVEGLAGRVRSTGGQIVWVGLGTPKQDYLVPRLSQRLPGTTVVPVGAAFDFLAGRVSEAPRWMHGSGLEWTHRLRMEPRRLWRRYLLGNPRFVMSALRHRSAAHR